MTTARGLMPSELLQSLLNGNRQLPLADILQQKNNTFGIGYTPSAEEEEQKKPPEFDPIRDIVRVDVHEPFEPSECTLVETFRGHENGSKKRKSPDSDVSLFNEKLREELFRCKVSVLSHDKQSKIDDLDEKAFREARGRANPFERITHGGFMNRAAFKLVEMDSVFGLTWEFDERDFCFVDVCGGPGSWTEYVLWRRAFCDHRLCTFGFGMTLRESLDWNMYKMNQWAKSMYRGLLHENAYCKAFYGPREDGNVTHPDNIRSLVSAVRGRSNLYLADGGFDVSESPNEQERLSQRLFLCQMALGMSVLADGGHLVCKLFDAFTQPTQDVIYIASRCFSQITLYKPVSSRPANSERYLVCKGFRDTAYTREAVAAMLELNEALERSEPLSLEHCAEYAHTLGRYHQSMLEDEAFLEYLRERNDTMAMSQISHLKRTFAYVADPYLQSVDQHSIGRAFFHYWDMVTEPMQYNPGRRAFEDYAKSIHSRYDPRAPKPNHDLKRLSFYSSP